MALLWAPGLEIFTLVGLKRNLAASTDQSPSELFPQGLPPALSLVLQSDAQLRAHRTHPHVDGALLT